ncbi:MAG TPA: BTAD domain-containing putative transcriptional regulator, partial [Gemmatimonadaceae bacterium]|nr:BTAD domain-containing putative transcriptional regulator [Gemmatimonadaceae bacterium]
MRLRTLGGLSVESNDAPLPGGAATQRRPLALLALLAAAGEAGISRDKLVGYLWPESDPGRARNVLKQTVYALRRDLRSPELIVGTTELRLNREVLPADVAEFDASVSAGDFERALALYGGPFLDGFYVGHSVEFERWVEEQRRRLHHRFAQAVESLAAAAAGRGEHGAAVALWRRMAAADPLDGRAAARLVRSLLAAGDRAGALRHARLYEELLKQELAVAPDAAFRALVNEIVAEPPAAPPPAP